MLVTILCLWLYDDDRFKMSVTESLCWRLFLLWWWFFSVFNPSPKSWIGQQPKVVTNKFVFNICHKQRCSRLSKLAFNSFEIEGARYVIFELFSHVIFWLKSVASNFRKWPFSILISYENFHKNIVFDLKILAFSWFFS